MAIGAVGSQHASGSTQIQTHTQTQSHGHVHECLCYECDCTDSGCVIATPSPIAWHNLTQIFAAQLALSLSLPLSLGAVKVASVWEPLGALLLTVGNIKFTCYRVYMRTSFID